MPVLLLVVEYSGDQKYAMPGLPTIPVVIEMLASGWEGIICHWYDKDDQSTQLAVAVLNSILSAWVARCITWKLAHAEQKLGRVVLTQKICHSGV